jgi:YegS/Rv2252/BmrU family lipid kinase
MTKRQAKPKKRAELVINLKSRRAARKAQYIIDSLNAAGVTLAKVHRMKNGSAIHRVMKQVVARKPSMVIIAGGDGTVSDAVDYLAHTAIELAIIPLGTTNNFARSIGISLSIDGAINNIITGTSKKVDLGSVNGDLFSNIASIGLSAEVAGAVTDKLKQKYGRLAYALVGLKQLLRHKPFHVIATSANSGLSVTIQTHQLIIANGRYHAGTVIATDAAPDTRELVVFKLGGRSRWSLLWHSIDFYIGKRRSVSHTAYLIAKDIRLKSDRKLSIELDGEVKETTPARISIKPAAITVRR